MFFEDMPKKAVAYCRVSSALQEERETIQNQVAFAENYCKLNGIELTHIYKDDGVTGTLPMNERPAGLELLQDAKKCKFTLVLVFKLDRLGRSTQVILNAVQELDGIGVKVRSMTEPFDTSDASGRFLLTILAGVADLERSNIIQRIGMGLDRAAKESRTTGGLPPYGYVFNKDNGYELATAPLPGLNMSEVDVVRMIFDLCLQGSSCQRTADRLNSMGVPTFAACRGKGKHSDRKTKWRSSTVYKVLKNETYKGTNYYNKRGDKELIARTVPPIISEDIWDKAQIKIVSNKAMIKGNVKEKYLLRGLVKCKHCGRSYSGEFSRTYAYYACNGRHKWHGQGMDKPCFGKSINRDWLEKVVWESCLEFIRNPQLVVKSIESEISQSEQIERDIAIIRARIAENAVAKQRLIELYKNGLISMDEVSAEFEKVDKEKSSANAELEKLEAQQRKDEILRQVDSATDLLDLLREKVDTPDVSFELKQAVIHIMVDKIVVDSSLEKSAIVTIHFKFGDNRTDTFIRRNGRRSSKSSSTVPHASPCGNVLEITRSFVFTRRGLR